MRIPDLVQRLCADTGLWAGNVGPCEGGGEEETWVPVRGCGELLKSL